MDAVPLIINSVMAVFSIVAIGFGLRRIGWLSEEADTTMLKLVINVLLPCLIFDSVIGNEALRQPKNLVGPPIAAFLMVGVSSIVAIWIAKWRATGIADDIERRTFGFSVGLQNYGYIPLPLAKMLFPEEVGTLGVLLVFMMGVELTVWTLGVSLLPGAPGRSGPGRSGPGRSGPGNDGTGSAGGGTPWYRRVINAPAIAIVVAVILNFMGAETWLFGQTTHEITLADGTIHKEVVRDFFAARVMLFLGQCAVPLGILLVGATVADYFGQTRFRASWRPIATACVLRLGLLPIVFIIAAAFTPGISFELRRVLVLEAAMPAAVYPIILSRLFGGDPPTAVRVAMSTSLVGLITIPAWIALGMWMIESTG